MQFLSLWLLFHFLLRFLFSYWSLHSHRWQMTCANLFSFHPKVAQGSLQSFFCAMPVRDASLYLGLLDSGLLHVFVVSGSHILALEQGLQLCRVPRVLRHLLLWGYGACTSFDPPVVRALLYLLLRDSHLHGLSTGHIPRVALSWIFTLALVPQWLNSPSLLMSVWASFGVQLFLLSERDRIEENKHLWLWRLSIWMYVFMMPILITSTSHPLSIIYNAIGTPVLTIGLVFIALFGWIDGLSSLITWLLTTFLQTLEMAIPFNIFRNRVQFAKFPILFGANTFGILCLLTMTFMYYLWRHRKRRRFSEALEVSP